MGDVEDCVVGGEDEFGRREVCQGRGEFVGAGVDGVPESGNGAETSLGVEFGLPVLGGGLIFEGGEDLEGGRGGGSAGFLWAQEPNRKGESEDSEKK